MVLGKTRALYRLLLGEQAPDTFIHTDGNFTIRKRIVWCLTLASEKNKETLVWKNTFRINLIDIGSRGPSRFVIRLC